MSNNLASNYASSNDAGDTAVSDICSTCDGLFHVRRRQKTDLDPIYHHHTIAKLKLSSENCEVCALIQAQITDDVLHEGRQHVDKALSCYTFPHWHHAWLVMFSLGEWSERDNTSVTVARISLVKIPEDQIPQRDELNHKSTHLPETVTLAKQWLQHCEEHHPKCKTVREQVHSVPTRLLDIGSSEEDPIQLLTTGIPSDVEYATLSHCWGGHEFITLTRDNIVSFQDSVLFSSLPKTFQDAVIFSRSLGFRYLWIDSLCIIQQDLEDWYSESARMSSVYGGSRLNIAGAGAKHGNEGLFFERNPALVKRLLVYADARLSEEPVKKDLPKDNSHRTRYYACDGRLYRRTFLDHPLFQRAWVFQERYLAPRTLYFGLSQVFWECQADFCFETFPQGMPPDIPINNNTTLVWERQKGFEDAWGAVVHEYSLGKLTKGSDKSIAISGVARAFGEKYSTHYRHGLWEESFPRALCWRGELRKSRRWVEPNKKVQELGHEKRAPSWSWISVDGPVGLCSKSEVKEVTCAVVKIEGPEDPYGNDPDGLVTLEVERLLEVTTLSQAVPNIIKWNLEFFSIKVTGMGDQKWELRAVFDHSDEEGDVIIPPKFYLLDIVERTEEAGSGILLATVRGKKGYFQRIGAYLTSGPAFKAFKEERQRKGLESEEKDLELYQGRGETKRNGTPTYILTLE